MNIELEWERKRNILKKQNIYIFLNQELECAKVIDKIMFSPISSFKLQRCRSCTKTNKYR